MNQSEDNHIIPMTSIKAGSGTEVCSDVFYYTDQIVNVVMLGPPDGKWVLIDAGMPGSGSNIIEAAEKRFGAGTVPESIILTHGHFDHVGGITKLLEHWKVSVYAHPLELPFLNGSKAYPEPDRTVEGGLLAKIADFYPHEPVNIAEVVHVLPQDSRLPDFPEWEWIHTPGHSPGHVSFFRQKDKVLISGDAVITVRQDSLYKVLTQAKELNGPPRYFTNDWDSAKASVITLSELAPEFIVAGHGQYLSGGQLKSDLKNLAEHFDELAKPKFGKYVNDQ
jgi:glyoxylase-like metal-dependent hydrolase (beta-lactamase superfamily II)